MSKYKATQKDLDLFEEFVCFFLKSLGIKDWEFSFEIDKSISDCRAYLFTDTESKIALFRLVENWDYILNQKELQLIAFHESCELFLTEINDKLSSVYNEKESARMVHSIIRTLENVLLPFLLEEYKKIKKTRKKK